MVLCCYYTLVLIMSNFYQQQSGLDHYFPIIHNPQPAIIKSKRLRRVVNYLRNTEGGSAIDITNQLCDEVKKRSHKRDISDE